MKESIYSMGLLSRELEAEHGIEISAARLADMFWRGTLPAELAELVGSRRLVRASQIPAIAECLRARPARRQRQSVLVGTA